MIKQGLHQSLQQKLSPQQIQLMKLIELSTLELEQKVKDEIETNPAIEDETISEEIHDENFESEDVQYIEKEFNNIVMDEGYKTLFNFLKLKEFVKLITEDIN